MSQEDKAGEMNRKAQSMLEYAVIIAVVVAALIAMSAYLKRGVQGKLRANVEELSGGNAYSPEATTAVSTITRSVTESSHSYAQTDTTSDGRREEVNITESSARTNQISRKQESLLPLSQEPVR